jgi:hypothetical protein
VTDIEQRLIKAARDGEWLECAEPGTVVRAGLIRELLLGRHGELDPSGIRLDGVRVEGTLNLNRVKAAVGLVFNDCTIDEPIQARYASLPDLLFFGGHCAGIHADGLQIDGDLFLFDGIHVTGDDTNGTIRLLGARIGGDLAFSGAEISNTTSTALDAAGLQVSGHMFFRDGVQITGQGRRGAVNLVGARIASNLEMTATEITNATGPAIIVSDANIGGGLFLKHGNRITGHGEGGALSLSNVRVSLHADLADMEITNPTGIALYANGLQVDGSLYLSDKIRISGHHARGAVDLMASIVGWLVQLTDATITNAEGPAITADRTQIGGPLFLGGQTRLSAGGGEPALSLIGARIGGRFGCSDVVEFESNPALNLQDATVGVSVRLPHEALCPDRGRGPTCEHPQRVRLDDFSYASLAAAWDWQQWLHVVRCHTPAYHASAYQRLAAVERAAGHDGTVRRILMAQQTDLRRRSPQSLGGPLTRWFHWLWGVLAGYGYRARRTAAALLLVLVAAGAIGWWAGQVGTRPGHHVAERVTTAGVPCSTVELVGLGLDRGLPLAMTGMRTRCDLDTASKKGQAFTAAIWLVQLAVWGLATLALAGYTNLVRKPG